MIKYDYDKEADVMYITFGEPLPCGTIEFEDEDPELPSGICLRFDPMTKKLNGITIVNYSLGTTDSKVGKQ